jgi:hypothetical protein
MSGSGQWIRAIIAIFDGLVLRKFLATLEEEVLRRCPTKITLWRQGTCRKEQKSHSVLPPLPPILHRLSMTMANLGASRQKMKAQVKVGGLQAAWAERRKARKRLAACESENN